MSAQITAAAKPQWAARFTAALRDMAGSGTAPAIVTQETTDTKLVVRYPSKAAYLDPKIMNRLIATMKTEKLAMVVIATTRGIYLTIGDEVAMEDVTGAKV